jgi:ABC-type polysaccharide transport system permease subunit
VTDPTQTLNVISAPQRSQRRKLRSELQSNWVLYLMALPAIVSILCFSYAPLFGLLIAFVDYQPLKGILGSEWLGLGNFQTAFADPFFWVAFKNSLIISALKLSIGFPSGLILALLINEARVKWMRSMVQTASILPYFMSWVVVGMMFKALLATDGPINEVRQQVLNLQSVSILSEPLSFLAVIVFQDAWKSIGYSALLYLAAMTAIDPGLYEAAQVDGATRWQQIWHITLPGISNTIFTLLIIAIGYLMSAGFEQLYVMLNNSVLSSGDILETYTLRLAFRQFDYGLGTAVGLFQGFISMILVVGANAIAKRVRGYGLF